MSSSSKPAPAVAEQDVFALTKRGSDELRGDAGTMLSAAELEILVLIDGRAAAGQVARAAAGQAPQAVMAALARYLAEGLIARAGDQGDAFDATGVFSSTEVAEGMSSLRDTGYFVRIARRATAQRKPAGGAAKRTLLIIDDDPDLVKLLQTYLKLEGFAVRSAANRDAIIAALREPAAPDLVLLDATLPDIDGFEVLARIRSHAPLKGVPVIMLTAKATREGVIKGLKAGCDGYVTKPFEIDLLIKAMSAVLGLNLPPPKP